MKKLRFEQAIRIIDENEFRNFYSENSDRITAEKFNVSYDHVLIKLLNYYNIERHTHKENIRLTCLARYGVHHSHTPESQSRWKQSILDRYGNWDSYLSAMNHSMVKTCREKYGCDYSAQSEEVKKKHLDTYIEKWGETSYFKTEEFKVKAKETTNSRYGVDFYSQTSEYREKYDASILNHFGSHENYVDSLVNKIKQTNLDKYGVENPSSLPDVVSKGIETKRRNHTFNTSSIEDAYFTELKEKYSQEDVIRQYSDDPRYPFACDFYIKSEDLFIEINAFWHHGPHPFDENSPEDLKLLDCWKEKSKTSKQYQEAIKTWTVRDVNKMNFVKENNLKYRALYINSKGDSIWLIV